MDSSEIELLENNILGAFMNDTSSHRFIRELDTDLFVSKKAKTIFKVIKELFYDKQEINIITINNKLSTGMNNSKALDELIKISDSIITTAFVESSIEKLKDINMRICLTNILTNSLSEVKNSTKESFEIKKDLQKNLVILKDTSKIDLEAFGDVYFNTLQEIENKKNKGTDYSLYTGFFDWDKLTDGFHENELTCIGARPGTGKTAIAINIANNIARRREKSLLQ